MNEKTTGSLIPNGPDWHVTGLEDDVRERMFATADAGETFALATIIAANGGPRPVGSQMVVTRVESWGFLSGGCIEADVSLNAREVIRDGEPRILVYGEGSPFIDIRLPCGGRIDVAIERISPGDAALANLRALTLARQPALWLSDGTCRVCASADEENRAVTGRISRRFDPELRLAVVGRDPFGLAIAGLGRTLGWQTILLSPFGPDRDPPFGVVCDRRPLAASLEALSPDPWTAIAIATHDPDLDHKALLVALASRAGYVGVLGSRRKLDKRLAALKAAGLSDHEIARLHAPIGVPIDARSPFEVAVAVAAEIIESSRSMATPRTGKRRALHVAF